MIFLWRTLQIEFQLVHGSHVVLSGWVIQFSFLLLKWFAHNMFSGDSLYNICSLHHFFLSFRKQTTQKEKNKELKQECLFWPFKCPRSSLFLNFQETPGKNQLYLSLLYFNARLKNLPAIQETLGSIPGLGQSPGEGNGNPLPVPGKFHGQRSLAGYSPWGCKRVRHDLVTKPLPPP